tara:strand:+ start:3335 stop:4351 length:1017 start_codon:yes stop_codon:yes gene_type:complete
MKLGDEWGDCRLVYTHHDKQYDKSLHREIFHYNETFVDSLNHNLWFCNEMKNIFSSAQTIAEHASGFHHSFLSDPSTFMRFDFLKSKNLTTMSVGLDLLVRSYGSFGYENKNKYAKTPEIFISANDSTMSMKDQESVFIVGGGPSTLSVDFTKYSEIPKWTMNNFFKNEKLRNLKNLQLATFLDDVNLNDPALWDSVQKNNLIVMQELSDPKFGSSRADKIFQKCPRSGFFLTRYRSRLGVGPRLIILAICLGIKNIYISGFDGYDLTDSRTHCFEANKQPPKWLQQNGPWLQKQQFVILWDYILNNLAKSYGHDFKIHDLSKGQETVQYKFIQDYIK